MEMLTDSGLKKRNMHIIELAFEQASMYWMQKQRANSTSYLSGEWRVTVLFFLQTELESEHCFEVVHRRQMFIIVSLFQRIILCWPAGKIICSSRKEPIIHKSSDWRPVFCILDDHENRKHNKNGLKQTKDIKMLTNKLNARREHESGTSTRRQMTGSCEG